MRGNKVESVLAPAHFKSVKSLLKPGTHALGDADGDCSGLHRLYFPHVCVTDHKHRVHCCIANTYKQP